jgi:AAA domain
MEIARAKSNAVPIMLLYGDAGRGKTTLATKAPKALLLPLERGLPRGVEVDAVQGLDSFDKVMSTLLAIHSDPRGYDSLVIDTLDALEPLVLEHTCAKNNWKNIEAPPYGKGWVAADDEWRRFIRGITAIRDKHNMTVVLVSHAEVIRVEDPRAPTFTSYSPKLNKRARALVVDACDVVGFLAEDLRTVSDDSGFRERVRAAAGNGRYLFLEGRPAFAAKNRFGMPEKMPIPLNFNFSALSQHWSQ